MGEQEWYYALDGRQLGPIDLQTLRGLLSTGNLQPADLVWRQGMDTWQPAAAMAELLPANAPIVPMATPTETLLSGSPLPYETATPNSQGRATTALVVSILGFFCFGIVLGPISVYLAVKAKANMARSGDFTGHGVAQAAMVIGIIDIFVFMLGVLLQFGIMNLR
jgi:hypothetical protein